MVVIMLTQLRSKGPNNYLHSSSSIHLFACESTYNLYVPRAGGFLPSYKLFIEIDVYYNIHVAIGETTSLFD
jgi:hypothetical protein